jgi:hypothetical protein
MGASARTACRFPSVADTVRITRIRVKLDLYGFHTSSNLGGIVPQAQLSKPLHRA